MRILDTCYVRADITRRRQANFDALQPKAGETILNLGCAWDHHFTEGRVPAVLPDVLRARKP